MEKIRIFMLVNQYKAATMKKIAKLIKHREKGKSKKFFKRLMKAAPGLRPYVSHRLRVLCALGRIPENMYQTDGIIDDVFIDLYENEDLSKIEGVEELKLLLFKKVNKHLKDIVRRESFHRDSISTDKLLQRELNRLKERFTFNADGDFIMNEELSDISYRQKDFKKEILLYDDGETGFSEAFDLPSMNDRRKEMISNIYRFLSPEASNVVDLHVFGKLSIYQIASIKETDEQTVSGIIDSVKEKINYAMGKLKN